jgi:hypothetical protein
MVEPHRRQSRISARLPSQSMTPDKTSVRHLFAL